MITTTTVQSRFSDLTQNSSSTNTARGLQLYNDATRFYITKYYLNEVLYTTTTTASTNTYNLPFDIKEVIDVYIVVGSLRYVLTEAPTTQFWDQLQFASYSSDIPQYYWIFNKQLYVFPTPSSSSNTIGIRYKKRIKDLSLADFTTGTVTATNGSTTITHSATGFYPQMAGQWIRLTASTSLTASGDEGWYEIDSYTNTSTLVLKNAYTGSTATGASFTIGEATIMPEDYQTLPLYRALKIYYTSIVPNPEQALLYDGLTQAEETKLDAEFGNKSTNVRITSADAEMSNPNLYIRSIG